MIPCEASRARRMIILQCVALPQKSHYYNHFSRWSFYLNIKHVSHRASDPPAAQMKRLADRLSAAGGHQGLMLDLLICADVPPPPQNIWNTARFFFILWAGFHLQLLSTSSYLVHVDVRVFKEFLKEQFTCRRKRRETWWTPERRVLVTIKRERCCIHLKKSLQSSDFQVRSVSKIKTRVK